MRGGETVNIVASWRGDSEWVCGDKVGRGNIYYCGERMVMQTIYSAYYISQVKSDSYDFKQFCNNTTWLYYINNSTEDTALVQSRHICSWYNKHEHNICALICMINLEQFNCTILMSQQLNLCYAYVKFKCLWCVHKSTNTK